MEGLFELFRKFENLQEHEGREGRPKSASTPEIVAKMEDTYVRNVSKFKESVSNNKTYFEP